MMGSIKVANAYDANLELAKSGEIRILQPIFNIYGKRRAFSARFSVLRRLNTTSGLRSFLKPKTKLGWAGIVVNGCIRDVDEINDGCDIGVRAMALHAEKPGKKGIAEEHVPIHVGGSMEL
ncbi:hypothetical protein BUALT_Bualt01G0173700 [Buddleja alternifolia]|uniref:Uncharacterized protein n=1 Tax=Buddleja alternifolia TaxID=168488 RepID=A0AAV6Y810_9LAMI|nr:hypothetical protein BUALT_Bualt01G0173700 [Buddleja alternifolia]